MKKVHLLKTMRTVLQTVPVVFAGLLLASCAQDGFDNDEKWESSVSDTQMVSPTASTVEIAPDATGNYQIISWPVVLGASGYECRLVDVTDPDKQKTLFSEVVDGCSFKAPREDDCVYEVYIKTLGNKEKNNADAKETTKLEYNTIIKTQETITSGTDLTTWFKDKALPEIKAGEVAQISEIEALQHFTKPPARYTEAALVHALEENGIGRPSTYAPTITTIVSRGYVRRIKKQLVPTELGRITTDIMKNHFEDIVDIEFTADMEEKLDEVEEGKLSWIKVLSEFYPEFESNLENAQKAIEKIKIKDEESDVVCDKCGRKMVYKIGKFGKFLACPGYPECKNTMSIRTEAGVKCPKCGGEILVKKTRKGKNYYGCENNPKCDFMVWDKPMKKETCPDCGGILLERKGKNAKIYCINEKCAYQRKPERKTSK